MSKTDGPELDLGPSEQLGRIGFTKILLCGTNLQSNPHSPVTWTFQNGQHVRYGAPYRLSTDGGTLELIISNLNKNRGYFYKCSLNTISFNVIGPDGLKHVHVGRLITNIIHVFERTSKLRQYD